MDGLDYIDQLGNNLNDFVKNYRDSIANAYASDNSLIEQQKNNNFASIMAGANKRGMMYSNFPERSKMQYIADTHTPALAQSHAQYQTGLDKLRSNAINTYNTIKNLEDAIADLNEAYT